MIMLSLISDKYADITDKLYIDAGEISCFVERNSGSGSPFSEIYTKSGLMFKVEDDSERIRELISRDRYSRFEAGE